MEDNKLYYTPLIEEFHVGFKYQMRESTIWYDTESTPSYIYPIGHRTLEDLVRVKYLDKDDIESCGFEIAFASDYLIEAYTDELILIYSSNDTLSIRYKDYNLAPDWNKLIEKNSKCIVFMGKVRNISELKVILHQIERG